MSNDTQQNIESPSVYIGPVQGMHMKVFSKVYCDRVYFLCAERFETGSGFNPPPPQRHPHPVQMRVEGGGGAARVPARRVHASTGNACACSGSERNTLKTEMLNQNQHLKGPRSDHSFCMSYSTFYPAGFSFNNAGSS